ncbi:YciI family protein [Streptomyces sp. NPDC056105]|uniref:YciI family protein n=1 Tax=Streptomyces sp. NPDC056105 TaxID=3345714 RepID=UPI0035E22BCF
MKYLMMVTGTQLDYEAMAGKASEGNPAWGEKDIQTMFAHMQKINDDLAETGEMLAGEGLAEPAKTRFVTPDAKGRPVVSDGPYGETKELLAGFWILECESLDRVTEIAERVAECPAPAGAPARPVVIRPILDSGGDLC